MFYSTFRKRSPHSKTALRMGSAIAAGLVLAIDPAAALAGSERGLGRGAGQGVEKPTKQIAQRQSRDLLPPALITAMRKDLYQYTRAFGEFNSLEGYIFFVDLNDDEVKEAIVYLAIGVPCSNRSCAIYIYTKVGSTYRRISANDTDSSAIGGSRNDPSIGILPTRSRGWHDLATRQFRYEPRSEVWTRIRYGNHGYSYIDIDVILPPPRRIIETSSGLYVDFNTLLVP